MILVTTTEGEHFINAAPEDVTEGQNGLTFKRGTTPIARFRRWVSWCEVEG